MNGEIHELIKSSIFCSSSLNSMFHTEHYLPLQKNVPQTIFSLIIHLLQQVRERDLNLSSPHNKDQTMSLNYKALNNVP